MRKDSVLICADLRSTYAGRSFSGSADASGPALKWQAFNTCLLVVYYLGKVYLKRDAPGRETALIMRGTRMGTAVGTMRGYRLNRNMTARATFAQ